jgi:hypothetical protein
MPLAKRAMLSIIFTNPMDPTCVANLDLGPFHHIEVRGMGLVGVLYKGTKAIEERIAFLHHGDHRYHEAARYWRICATVARDKPQDYESFYVDGEL